MKKKILFVNGHLNIGGVEKSLVNILTTIDYSKYDVDLLLLEAGRDYLSEIPNEVNVISCNLEKTYGSTYSVLKKSINDLDYKSVFTKLVFTISNRLGPWWMTLLKASRILPKQYDYAIAYRVGICAEYVAFVASATTKLMWWHHGMFEYPEKTVRRWNSVLRKIDKLVCVSEATKELIKPYLGKHVRDIVVIPNLIRTEDILDKAEQESLFKNINGDTIIVSVGRLSEEKHFENCIYAAKKLVQNRITAFRWYIIGDGLEYCRLKDMINKAGLQKHVFLTGKKNNPYPYIKNADLFVHPSYVESQGLVILEAMALGIPCIVTKSLGPCEFIEDGVNGLLTEQSKEALAEAVIRVTRDRTLYQSIRDNTVCPEQFMPKVIMDRIESLLEDTY